MAEVTTTPIAPTPSADAVHVAHYCEHEHCKKWGAFGFSQGKSDVRWWCAEHYPHWNGDRNADRH